jgi:hypothetical protein
LRHLGAAVAMGIRAAGRQHNARWISFPGQARMERTTTHSRTHAPCRRPRRARPSRTAPNSASWGPPPSPAGRWVVRVRGKGGRGRVRGRWGGVHVFLRHRHVCTSTHVPTRLGSSFSGCTARSPSSSTRRTSSR